MSDHNFVSFDDLVPQKNYWFWLNELGKLGKPELLIFDGENDENGYMFFRSISEIKWRLPVLGFDMKGFAQMTNNKRLLLTSSEPIHKAAHLINSLRCADRLFDSCFETVVIIRTSEGTFSEISLSTKNTNGFPLQCAVLDAMQKKGDKAYFWLTEKAITGEGLLLLSTEKSEIKALIKESKGEGRAVRGRVIVDKKQRLNFRVTKKYKRFVADLAEWVLKNHTTNPSLLRLKHSYISLLDEAGEEVAKRKDEAAWEQLGEK
jgi:hypothetical protein